MTCICRDRPLVRVERKEKERIKMKKLTCCLLILAIIFSFAFGTCAWAEGLSRYDFRSEQGTISLDIDESLWFFVTQDNIAEKLDPEKADVQGWLDYMIENSIVAEGSIFYENTDTSFNMQLYQFTMSPEEAVDFRTLSDAEIEDFTELINEDLLAAGYEILLGAEMSSTANQLMYVCYEYCSEGHYAMDYVSCLGNVMYQLRFQCTEPFVLEEYEEIDRIVESLSFTAPVGAEPAPERSFRMPTALDILISFILTVAFYSLPIIIYRYVLRKAPVENKKAKKITIIYAIAAYVLVLALNIYMDTGNAPGRAIILWSYLNYRMLTN